MERIVYIIRGLNPIVADEIIEKLAENHIAALLSENSIEHAGRIFGEGSGIAVMVSEKDAEAARAIIKPILRARRQTQPWCPFCGSEDVEERITVRRNASRRSILIDLVLLLIAAAAWITGYTGIIPFANGQEIATHVIPSICIVMALTSLWPQKVRFDHHCKHCKRDFKRISCEQTEIG